MCKVYEFPAKSCLPREIEKRLEELAKDYVNEIFEIVGYLEDRYYDGRGTDEQMAAVLEFFTIKLGETIDEL